MNKNILNEVNTIKKMMGLMGEQTDITDAGSEYRTRSGIKLNKINSEEDLKKFITLSNEITIADAYKQLTGMDDSSEEILERFNQITTDFLKFLAMKCENYRNCELTIEHLYNVYANNKKTLYGQLGIENKYPKNFTSFIWNNHVKPKLTA